MAQTEGPSVLSSAEIVKLAQGFADLKLALEAGAISVTDFIDAASKLPGSFQAVSAAATAFQNVISNLQKAYAASADLAANNVDELVSLYQAQINVISSQNRMTQAIALNAVATQVYGKNSLEAQRTTVALNYTSALYTQSKKNELVAQFDYTTATAKNLATMATSFTQLEQAMVVLVIAIQALAISAEESAAKAALAAIPIVGLIATLGITAYQMATTKGYQAGGYVAKSGLAIVHQGETVIPATGNNMMGGAGSAPKVEIHIHATSDVDLAKVRQEVQNALAKTFYQAQKSRGVYG